MTIAHPAPHIDAGRKSLDHWLDFDIVVGKDVLELLSSAMYVDPLSIYREYVQNAADSIDLARQTSLLGRKVNGRLEISLDSSARVVRIRDNGVGIQVSAAMSRLLSIGASSKRGSQSRGFRGVGRLAGLAYCRVLTFRTRSADDNSVIEVSWDCQKLKAILRDSGTADDLARVIRQIIKIRNISPRGFPEHFFEVEMADVVRYRNDILLNAPVVGAYLSQVAPVPFRADFAFGDAITTFLRDHVAMGDLCITLTGHETPITRPHSDRLMVSEKVRDRFTDLETLELTGVDGNAAARGWILHHHYLGALPDQALVKGLRLRAGNIQVGSPTILEDRFPEARFNAWTVGEIHVIDPRILPNGRRDHFEQNNHFANLAYQVTPFARAISKRCRDASIERNRLREFERRANAVREKVELLKRPAVAPKAREEITAQATQLLGSMARLSGAPSVSASRRNTMLKRIGQLTKTIGRQENSRWDTLLESIPKNERRIYEDVVRCIIESADHETAQRVIERIMAKLARQKRLRK